MYSIRRHSSGVSSRPFSRRTSSGHASASSVCSPSCRRFNSACWRPAELDLLAPVQRIDDAAKHGVDDNFRMLLREVGDVGQFLHEWRLRQSAFGHWLVFRQKGTVVGTRRGRCRPATIRAEK